MIVFGTNVLTKVPFLSGKPPFNPEKPPIQSRKRRAGATEKAHTPA
jgi:hypothetical protein